MNTARAKTLMRALQQEAGLPQTPFQYKEIRTWMPGLRSRFTKSLNKLPALQPSFGRSKEGTSEQLVNNGQEIG